MRVVVLGWLLLFVGIGPLRAQEQEIEQLLLDVEKLVQFKQILADMKDGYDILVNGYGTIKDLSEGNFDLHQQFLDGLLQVSPTVQQYKRIADIIEIQIRLTKDCKAAIRRFGTGDLFDQKESNYLKGVYQRVLSEGLQHLDDLGKVITAGTLRMSDDERLTAIDQIYEELSNEEDFLRSFSVGNNVLLLQRAKALREAKVIEDLYQNK